MLLSYDAVVNNPIHRQVFEDVVPGALEDFDVPDLVAAIAPRSVLYARASYLLDGSCVRNQRRHVSSGRFGMAVRGVVAGGVLEQKLGVLGALGAVLLGLRALSLC